MLSVVFEDYTSTSICQLVCKTLSQMNHEELVSTLGLQCIIARQNTCVFQMLTMFNLRH